MDSHGLRLRWRPGFLSGRPEMRRDKRRCPRALYSIQLHMLWAGLCGHWTVHRQHRDIHSWLACMAPASRTLESHNFMQQRQQCIVPSLAQSLLISMHTSISYNCSLPYVFSNSFHPRISRHPFCMFGLVCFVLFCFVSFWKGGNWFLGWI